MPRVYRDLNVLLLLSTLLDGFLIGLPGIGLLLILYPDIIDEVILAVL